MAASRQIIDLRNLLAERFQQSPTLAGGQIVTGIPAFDKTISGGLRKGAITEIISPNTSYGSALVIHSLLQVAQRDRFFLAFINGLDWFFFQCIDAITLQHLLWVRCDNDNEELQGSHI